PHERPGAVLPPARGGHAPPGRGASVARSRGRPLASLLPPRRAVCCRLSSRRHTTALGDLMTKGTPDKSAILAKLPVRPDEDPLAGTIGGFYPRWVKLIEELP